MMMKRTLCLLCAALVLMCAMPTAAIATTAETTGLTLDAPSAILVHASGAILYEKNADEPRIPASVTKVMTLLIIMEGLESGALTLDEMVTGSAHAKSMGGATAYLDVGEQLSVEDMIKCIAIESANDCSVAMAEHMAGSEEAFVTRMNGRALELGMHSTTFADASGLSKNNRTTAYDVAIMSMALMRHEAIVPYSTTWMDSIRDGAFGLNNRNKMLKTYDGLTGLKTGYIDASGYNITATATRGDLDLIAVIMGGATAEGRNADAAKLLNYGFASFASVALTPDTPIMPVEVYLGKQPLVVCDLSDSTPRVYEKAKLAQVEKEVVMNGPLTAPVAAGTPVGELVVRAGGEVIARVPIVTQTAVERQGVWDIFLGLLRVMTLRR